MKILVDSLPNFGDCMFDAFSKSMSADMHICTLGNCFCTLGQDKQCPYFTDTKSSELPN